ncbi:MAG: InlB B-repeat-containing protein, partial [Candidatus Methanomethylophilaceae archaeon]|nr:InlB B-repeat-containing protein [Candidatus Methanomethylophilaceae archaeon]
VEQDYGSAISVPNDPVRTGYTFTGWDADIPGTLPDEDLVFNAVWQINRHTVTFHDGYGGTIGISTQDYGSQIVVPDDPSRTGHTFTGWDSVPPGTLPDSDVTIAATWSINSYTITFNSAGGSPVSQITAPYGSELECPPDPFLTGFSFRGWNVPFPETMPAEDLTLTATWRINQYTITFDTVGGTEIDGITANYGSPVSSPADPVRTGYRFVGWNSDIPSNMPARDLTITARWSINQYTISFNTAGGSEIASIIQDYDTVVSMGSIPVRTGYTFSRWNPAIPERMPAENTVVTASWTVNRYTISFLNTGDSVIQDITADYGSSVTAPGDPVRTGYTFTGWSAQVPSTMPAADTVLTAKWSVNQYTMSFNSAGGSAVASIVQDYGSDIVPPSDPTRTGYTFTGWSTQVPAKMPASDMTITAQWSINQYTIAFDTAGGSEIGPLRGDYASAVPEVPVPLRTGHTFTGWSRSIPATFPAEDLTLTASWSVNQYTIVFDSAGGSQVSAVKQDYGSVILPPSDPVRTGYTFVRWSSQIPDRMPASDMTITAQWSINQYTVRFLNTGDSTIPSVTADYGSEIEVPQAPVKTGYTFVRWDSEIPAKMPAFDTDISAVWRINQYTITFDTRGGTSVGSITADYGSAVRPVNDPTRTGHSFEGWNVPVPQTMPASDITITAQWRINQYSITFDSAGGSEMRPCTGDYGSAVPFVSVPVRTGYTFTGWSQSIPDTFPGEDLTLTASWSVNQYTISFDTAGGSAVDSIRRDYGSAILPPSDPIRTGYTFTGWSSDIPTEMPASDMNITAQWRINRYTISFDTAGGSAILPITGDYGSAVPEVAVPVREGHTFRGWSQLIPDTIPAGDLSLTAAWAVNRYTISFDTAGGSSVQDITQDYGSLVAAPPQPVRDGHTFAGWSQSIPETMPASDLRITARWSVNQYTISFDPAGGSAVSPMKLEYGSSVTPPAVPQRTGYRFVGWDPAIPTAVPSHDVSVTAVWQINR